MTLQVNTDKVLEIFKETVAETAARLNQVHESLWTARLDAIRSIIAVATAVLAGLVVFLEKLLVDLTWTQRFLLLASWVLLLGSIGFGLAVNWLSITLRSFHPALFNSQLEIESECAKLDPAAPDLREQIAGVIKVVVDKVTDPIGVADSRANRAAHLCLVLFLLSLLFLVAFASARVLCGDT